MRFNASVAMPASIIQELSIGEIERHFKQHQILFRGFNYSVKNSNTKMINFNLNGEKSNLRMSIKNLYTLASQRVFGMESKPAKFIPENLKNHLELLEDPVKYNKLFDYCANEYIKHCENTDQAPHPEVVIKHKS